MEEDKKKWYIKKRMGQKGGHEHDTHNKIWCCHCYGRDTYVLHAWLWRSIFLQHSTLNSSLSYHKINCY